MRRDPSQEHTIALETFLKRAQIVMLLNGSRERKAVHWITQVPKMLRYKSVNPVLQRINHTDAFHMLLQVLLTSASR
jgi:hypothetical protein